MFFPPQPPSGLSAHELHTRRLMVRSVSWLTFDRYSRRPRPRAATTRRCAASSTRWPIGPVQSAASLAVPAGSTLVVRATGIHLDVAATGGLAEPSSGAPSNPAKGSEVEAVYRDVRKRQREYRDRDMG
jgi:hypothetical protein